MGSYKEHMANKPNIIAVNRTDVQGAGAIVWWKISGHTEVKALTEAWTKRVDLDPDLLMNDPTPGAALRRALACHAHTVPDGRQLVSGLGDENSYAIVRETPDGQDVHHKTLLKARLAQAAGEGPVVYLWDHDDAPRNMAFNIQQTYRANLTTFSGQDVSNWFATTLLPAYNAVSLREQGGMWFVPRTHLALWREAVAAIREVSGHQVFEIPALSTEHEAIAGILDAIASEAETAATKLEDELLNDDGSLGVRALKSRATKLDGVANKVTSYENMLGVSLDNLRNRLEKLNAVVAAAIFTAEAAKDAEEGAVA